LNLVLCLGVVTIHEIASKLEKGSQVDIILLDFANAFDKRSHQRLLHSANSFVADDLTISGMALM
jgi:hypothetical protein